MLSRFKQNVKNYPKTAAVLGAIYLGAGIGSVLMGRYLNIDLKHQVLTALGALLVIALFDGITYIWFMGDPFRVQLLLELLNNFEGRTTAAECGCECGCCECGCECGCECPPEDYEEEDEEESDEEESDEEESDEEESDEDHAPDEGQVAATIAVTLVIVLGIIIGTVLLISGKANEMFSNIGGK